MTTKICELETLESLYSLGYSFDTPVTYLYDEKHVWFETVTDA